MGYSPSLEHPLRGALLSSNLNESKSGVIVQLSHALVPLAVVFAFGACSSPTADPDPPPTNAVLTARIDGVPFTNGRAAAVLSGAGNFTIASGGVGNGTSLSLQLFSIGRPGTYPLGVTPGVVGGAGALIVGGTQLQTPNTGVAGTVTITSISLTRITGAFSFTATRATFAGGAESKAVTDGQFDVAVTGDGTLEIPPNIGSTVTGKINLTDFFATQVSVPDAPSSGTLLLDLRQSSRKLTVEITGFTGVGTYDLGAGTARRLRYEAFVGDFPSTWGGSNPTTSGTVVVTSITPSRVQGTIEATLTPTFAPLGTKPAAVSIRFDVGLP